MSLLEAAIGDALEGLGKPGVRIDLIHRGAVPAARRW